MLSDPEFVFRVERAPTHVKAGSNHRISDLEFASRLSFFLWSSGPDEVLIRLAADGRSRNPVVLEQQVRRMLADERAEALARNFASQWLHLRNLRELDSGSPALSECRQQPDECRWSARQSCSS